MVNAYSILAGAIINKVIGGIYFGFFNPTPAAAVGAADSPFGVTTEDLKIWFGILALIVVELGLITPPVGMNVFIISAQVPDVPMRRTFLGVVPFFGAEIVRVSVLVAFPALTLWLPELLGG